MATFSGGETLVNVQTFRSTGSTATQTYTVPAGRYAEISTAANFLGSGSTFDFEIRNAGNTTANNTLIVSVAAETIQSVPGTLVAGDQIRIAGESNYLMVIKEFSLP